MASCRSCGAMGHRQRLHRCRFTVYSEVLRRVRGIGVPEALSADFENALWAHFSSLPARYALNVDVARAEDVLTHMCLIEQAKKPGNGLAFAIQVAQDVREVGVPGLISTASEPELCAHFNYFVASPMHEIIFSTQDRPKFLCQLTSLFAELDLNIQEAHAFSTNDGYSIDIFIVDGWPHEDAEKLTVTLKKEIENREGMRHVIPKNTHPTPVEMVKKRWKKNPAQRPEFPEILVMLHDIGKEVADKPEEQPKEK